METQIAKKLPQIIDLFIKYGAKSAYLFGSFASKNATKTSDVDFLFSFHENMNYEIYADNYFNLLYDLQDLLKRNVDLVAEKTLKNPYLIESINESKIQII